jgi:membrane fusion protein, copper/silver efflux system
MKHGNLAMTLTLGLSMWSACKPNLPNLPPGNKNISGQAKSESMDTEQHVITWYHCAMHPQILRMHPGNCPICGMTLVPVPGDRVHDHFVDSNAGIATVPAHVSIPSVRLGADQIRAIGVRTEVATRQTLRHEIRLDGRLALDPSRVQTVTSRVSGYLTWVTLKIPGNHVGFGENLALLYSPDLVASQQELLQARQYRLTLTTQADARTQNFADSLVVSARRRLINMGIADNVVRLLESKGVAQREIPLPSPLSGLVLERQVETGQAVAMGAVLFRIADLSHVYAVGQVSQADLMSLQKGVDAEVELPGLGGKKYHGWVTSIAPTMNPETRTAELRVLVKNSADFLLKPEMLVVLHVQIKALPGLPAIVVPEQAVLRSGMRNVILVEEEAGVFRPREVELGQSFEGKVEVTSGLQENEKVVTTSQFLIDSESNLRAAVNALQNPSPSENGK